MLGLADPLPHLSLYIVNFLYSPISALQSNEIERLQTWATMRIPTTSMITLNGAINLSTGIVAGDEQLGMYVV